MLLIEMRGGKGEGWSRCGGNAVDDVDIPIALLL
jgi:hypothetical protein